MALLAPYPLNPHPQSTRQIKVKGTSGVTSKKTPNTTTYVGGLSVSLTRAAASSVLRPEQPSHKLLARVAKNIQIV